MRHRFETSVQDIHSFKHKALWWAQSFDTFTYLDSNQYQQDHHSTYECLMGVDIIEELIPASGGCFEQLKDLYDHHKDWLFGYCSYDTKNEIEKLNSNNIDHLDFPAIYFFRPAHIIELQGTTVRIHSTSDPKKIFEEIRAFPVPKSTEMPVLTIQSRFSRQQYFETVEKIREHIAEGDVYELNLCQEFFAENTLIEPAHLFQKLNEKAQSPFAAFLKIKDKFLLSASPERFMKKVGDKLLSQPMKGTARRGKTIAEDELISKTLQHDLKERAENVMIVDLVRNDLSRSCVPGSVKVEELFGIYRFPTVHQMISTVSGQLRQEVHFVDAIRNAFPMGSMTGAPKIMAMELIEQYEKTKRGLYSGTVGYITPEGDFDFNVVIRSILYNHCNGYLSFQTGGAITYDSDPEKEYEECLLKAKAMLEVLSL